MVNQQRRVGSLPGLAALVFVVVGCGPKFYQASFDPLSIRAVPPAPVPPMAKIEISERVRFRAGSAVLLEASHAVLDEVVGVLEVNPAVRLVEIQGHTDASGQMDVNLRLSRSRAQAVRDYLISQGVAPERLTAKGYGPEQPIADNETREGRRTNRRVEFAVIDAGGAQ